MDPVKFVPNRVWRAYLGGLGIDQLSGKADGKDNHFPEDWIASCVEANNPQYDCPGQGLSRVQVGNSTPLFRDWLASDPEAAFGKEHLKNIGPVPGLLMKILDSAERLPIQTHPDIPTAQKYFHADHGKTECWVVVGSRVVNGEQPYLLLGFNEKLNQETFLNEARQGEFPTGAGMLHKWTLKPGEAIIVPGGIPHAIGPGVTVIEVMEPSDLVVQPEHFCGEQPLTDSERFSGAPEEDAYKAFDFKAETMAQVRARCFIEPELIAEQPSGKLYKAIPESRAKLFEVQRLELNGLWHDVNPSGRCRAGVVTAGETGTLSYNGGSFTLRPGESFFLPAAAKEITIEGNLSIVFAIPPAK